jgi:transcriptional regulator with XRE-family HTH domain
MPSFNTERFQELARERGDTTLDAIAQRTGLHKGLLSRLTRGERQPTIDTLAAIADGYHVPTDELILREAAA